MEPRMTRRASVKEGGRISLEEGPSLGRSFAQTAGVRVWWEAQCRG